MSRPVGPGHPLVSTLEFQNGLRAYRQGHFYEAHEHWESLWIDEDDDDRRRLLQGVIKVATALHKLEHGVAPRGSLVLLDSALEKLDGLPDGFEGVELPPLRAGIRHCRVEAAARLQEAGGGKRGALGADSVPPIRIRGKE